MMNDAPETSLLYRAAHRIAELRLLGALMEYTPGIERDGEEIGVLLVRGEPARLLTVAMRAADGDARIIAHAVEALLLLSELQPMLERKEYAAVCGRLEQFYLPRAVPIAAAH